MIDEEKVQEAIDDLRGLFSIANKDEKELAAISLLEQYIAEIESKLFYFRCQDKGWSIEVVGGDQDIKRLEAHASEMMKYLEAVIESFDADGGIMLFNLMPGIRELVNKVKEIDERRN